MYQREGFPNQRRCVLPRPLIPQILVSDPQLSNILVTDCGYYPHALHHGCRREHGLRSVIVIACAEGYGRVELPDGQFTVGPGNVVAIPPGTGHSYYADDTEPWTIWWFHATGAAVDGILDSILDDRSRPLLRVRDVAWIAALVNEMIDLLSGDGARPSLLAASAAAHYLLARLGVERIPLDAIGDDPLAETLSHLREHVEAPTSTSELATRAGYSASHFSSLFAKRTGMSVTRYTTQLKMAKARELLTTTDLPVTEIAQQVGYADRLYFSRRFHAMHGQSPSQFRQHEAADDLNAASSRTTSRAKVNSSGTPGSSE